jgi:hypothetical protein
MTGILNALIAGVSGAVKDTYFNLVSLLLPGNGTNGAQNNTFFDSSGQNGGAGWTITRNPTSGPNAPTQGTFSPFSQTGWGNYFDGASDYLSATANAAFDFGTGDFTIEVWVYTDGTTETFGKRVVNKFVSNGWLLEVLRTSGNTVRFLWVNSSNTTVADIGTNDALTAFTWHHIAVSRSGANISLYVDGSRKATSSSVSGGTDNVSNNLLIGSANLSDTHFDGYISNARLVKGTAVYDPTLTTITVPTTPLTAITNTSLLTCQSNRFIDNSSSPKTITANGNVAVTPFSPFAPTQSYSASAVGGSGYFDGTGDYLSIASNAAFQFGAGNFTLEAWVYLASYNGSLSNMIVKKYTAAFPTCEFLFQIGSTGQLSLAVDDASNETFITTATSVVPVGAWAHCVATRSGSALRLFVNGKLVKYGTTALTIVSTSTPVEIGNNIIGNIGGLRIFKGSIPTDYQTSSTTEGTQIFTPPTAPLTTTSQGGSSPSLLLNFTNAGITDATAKNVLETVGNAQISTTQSKWGGGSISFDGTSNTGLKAPAGNLFTFGSGAFTVEFWVRFNSVAADQAVLNVTGTTNVLTFYVLSTGSLNYYLSSNGSSYDIASGVSVGSISTGQWYRVALVRSGNTFTPYLNTTAGTTSTSSSALATPSSGTFLHLGMSTAGTSNFNGYIDDVRVTRGVARDMTVLPTAPFPVQ